MDVGFGLDMALGELTLVLFTTLAPSGAVAAALMMLVVAARSGTDEMRRRVSTCVFIPLVVAMVGLVASATHLGNPSNALYVFSGVGRSPLSTEVFCAVVFLTLTGLYWLYSFAEHPREKLQRVWAVLIAVSAAAFVTSVAFAYRAETIVSWNVVHVPLALWLNALVGGPLMALVGMRVARFELEGHPVGRALLLLAGVALAANVGVYVLQAMDFAGIENSVTSVQARVPFYGVLVALFALAGATALAIDARAMLRLPELSAWRAAVACALALAGIFIMRFAFYLMHLTVGISV